MKTRQRVENVLDIFRISSSSSSSSNSSSPGALAHERCGVRKYSHHHLTPLSLGCILLYTRMCRELVSVMAIFWTSWLVATNMTPFAMTFHNRLQAAEWMRETSCLCAKTVATASRLVFLLAGLFALHCRSGRLQTCCFNLFAFRQLLRLNQKPPFAPPGSFSLSFALVTSV